MNYKALKDNLTDVMKEFQLKIGYSRTPMHLYYPLESLNRLLETDLNEAAMQNTLTQFSKATEDYFHGLQFGCKNARFRITIPEAGVEYLHDTVPDPPFLQDFLRAIEGHPHSVSELLPIFRRYSEHVCHEKLNNGEFDDLIYFEDGEPDAYRYCIKFEDHHIIYHRFTQKDYEALGM